MIHGYHVNWGTYGFWLPNDPRGSWSDFVASWELSRFGKATKSFDRTEIAPEEWVIWRNAATVALKYPPVHLTGRQALSVGTGFGNAVRKSRYAIWACSTLPEYVHLVIGRHSYKVERICNMLKGEATKQVKSDLLHPHANRASADGKTPSMWAEKEWIEFLDTEEVIENAIRYVKENPMKEGKPRQRWSFVTPFSRVNRGGWMTYH